MPIYVFAALVLTVIAVAGATIALIWAAGINLVWLGLAAVLASLLVRRGKW